MAKYNFTVDGKRVSVDAQPELPLLYALLDDLGLNNPHFGCGLAQCGACTVHLDGQPVKSCTILAVMCDGQAVDTVESLERDGRLDPVQQGFHELHALQCGFCTPGMQMTARALLNEGLAIHRETDNRNGLARALSHVGFLEYLEGRQEHARAAYREGLALARTSNDRDAVAGLP